VNLNPNCARAHNQLGVVNIYRGQPLAAISPYRADYPARSGSASIYPLSWLGLSGCLQVRSRRGAVQATHPAQSEDHLSRAFLAVALGHLGNPEEAGRVRSDLMGINPKYSFAEHVGRLPFRNQADVDRLVEGLSKAGIPA
jgi:adenylate cyclase